MRRSVQVIHIVGSQVLGEREEEIMKLKSR